MTECRGRTAFQIGPARSSLWYALQTLSTFRPTVNIVNCELRDFRKICIDALTIFSPTVDDHMGHLRLDLSKLRAEFFYAKRCVSSPHIMPSRSRATSLLSNTTSITILESRTRHQLVLSEMRQRLYLLFLESVDSIINLSRTAPEFHAHDRGAQKRKSMTLGQLWDGVFFHKLRSVIRFPPFRRLP